MGASRLQTKFNVFTRIAVGAIQNICPPWGRAEGGIVLRGAGAFVFSGGMRYWPKARTMRPHVTMITLGVTDLGRSKAFYEGLGWEASPKSMDDLVLFHLGKLLIALFPRESLAEDVGVPDSGKGFAAITLCHNTQDRAETDAVLRQAGSLGGKVVKPAQEVFWGGYSGYFADPDGHLWEVAHNPFWPLDEQGNVIF